ncbi:MAG: hypothetical protein EPN82_14355 [Bacteroidetes bacterium]|nr:MAG: hypothetical protein EPN82_14355 [Bacteroidota bacterium]
MNIKKFTASYSVFAEDKDEAWARVDEIVNNAMTEEATLSNTFALLEEELTKEEIKIAKMMKSMNDIDG